MKRSAATQSGHLAFWILINLKNTSDDYNISKIDLLNFTYFFLEHHIFVIPLNKLYPFK